MQSQYIQIGWHIVRYILNWPVWLVSRKTRRNPSLWVFGAWNGERFSGNASALAIRANRESDLRVVWLATSRTALKHAREVGLEAFPTYSVQGYKVSLTAGVGVVSTSHRDINQFAPPPNLLNLWHGIPLKRIGWDAPSLRRALNRAAMIGRVLPFHAPDLSNHVAASSPWEAERMASAFRLPRSHVHVIGQPRNDRLGGSPAPSRLRKVLYVPTFRQGVTFDPVDTFMSAAPIIEQFCQEQDVEFWVMWHPNIDPDRGAEGLRECGRVSLIKPGQISGDFNGLLNEVDLLVTDYSSVYFDFLLTQRPIVFAAFDLDEYTERDRGFYLDYSDSNVTPGPKCTNWESVIEAIANLLDDPDAYAAERWRARNAFHQNLDGGASERALVLARSLVDA